MTRLKDIENNVEMDAINMEKYRELSKVCWDTFRAIEAMFEQEHLRFINMFAATGGSGSGGPPSTAEGSWSTRLSPT